MGGCRAGATVRYAAVELHAVGHRREPLGDPAGAARDRRPKVLVFAYCYHGSVDEAFALPGPDGKAQSRPGNVAPPVDLDLTTRVATWNDLASVEAALAHGDVAAVLTEPALTNIGIVLPEPGFLEGVRELATRYGALLMVDETHTFSAGWGGATTEWGLEPDVLVIGKSIGGGIPCGAYGLSHEVAAGGHPPHRGRGRRHRRRGRRRRDPRRQRAVDRRDARHPR